MHKALFLDRDGVINVDSDYVSKIEDFKFVNGIFEVCTRATELDYLLIVVTNQAGIGRGYYREADFQMLTTWMLGQFEERGISIRKVYHCPYHPVHGKGEYKKESEYRKPAPGMILQARDEFSIDLSESILIGDHYSDIDAGNAAGIARNFLLGQAEGNKPPPRNIAFQQINTLSDVMDLL